MSKINNNSTKGILLIIALLFIPIPILLIAVTLFGFYGIIIFLGGILLSIVTLHRRIKNKKDKALNIAKDLDLKSKDILDLQKMKAEEKYKYDNMESIIINKHILRGSLRGKDQIIDYQIKFEQEKIELILYAIQMEIENRNKKDKKDKISIRREKDNWIKNCIYTIIAMIILFISGFLITFIILESSYQLNISVSDGILFIPLILPLFGYTIQRLIRLRKIPFKSY